MLPCIMLEISDGIYLGDVDDAGDLELLRSNGIRKVVNCADNCRCFFKDNDAMAYLHLKLKEESKITDEMVRMLVKFIDDGDGNVLVHCMAGAQRSPTIIIVYLVSKGMTLKEAVDLVNDKTHVQYFPTIEMLDSVMELFKGDLGGFDPKDYGDQIVVMDPPFPNQILLKMLHDEGLIDDEQHEHFKKPDPEPQME